MKRLAFILFLLVPAGIITAQTSNDEIEYIQAIFGMEKRAAVKEFIELQANETDAFWTLYDAYEIKRKEYGKERIMLLDKFVEQYDRMTDAESSDWMKSVISLRKKNEKLIETFYKRMVKDCSPVVAMQFYQIESYLLAGIRYQILENIPF